MHAMSSLLDLSCELSVDCQLGSPVHTPAHLYIVNAQNEGYRLRREFERASGDEERLHDLFLENIRDDPLCVVS